MENKYPSIEKLVKLSKHTTALIKKLEENPEHYFYYEEKIHGMNYSFKFSNNTVEVRSRECVIGIYNELEECDKISKNVINRVNIIIGSLDEDKINKCKEYILFGEIYGGFYGDVKSKTDRIIQHGISYSIDNDFMLFDVMVDGVFMNMVYWNQSIYKYYYNHNQSSYKNILSQYDAIQEMVNNLESEVYKFHSMPKLTDNYAEGIVIRSSIDPNVRIKVISKRYQEMKIAKLVNNTNQTVIDLKKQLKDKVNYKLLIDKTVGKFDDVFKNTKNIKKMIAEDIASEYNFTDTDSLKSLEIIAGEHLVNYLKNLRLTNKQF
jgi:hypothetical protein